MELISPKVEYYFSGDNKGKPTTKSVIGYMVPYREELWKSWMKQVTLQSESQFIIRTGLQESQPEKVMLSNSSNHSISLDAYISVFER